MIEEGIYMALDVTCDNEGCCNCKDRICLIEWTGCPNRKKDPEPALYKERLESIYGR